MPDIASIQTSRKELLGSFLSEFNKVCLRPETLVSEWNELCPLTGKKVTFQSVKDKINLDEKFKSGIFCGVDQSGWAIIEIENNSDFPEKKHFPPGTIKFSHKGCYQ